jgi:glucosamine--fructose-6-phosphate aminotransferase (isomerizing)
MCGIVGYIGKRNVVPILIAGLKRLEYRGYDSAGVAIIEDDQLQIAKEAGKISKLEETINQADYVSTIGIGHTRWATHGEPTRLNAHPHTDGPENIAIIHNGIIENYSVLKSMLENKGHQFSSDTDTEIVVHLIDEFYQGDFEEAFRRALGELTGAYGFAVISKYEPDKIYVARQGSPLVVGVGDGENFLASDVSAIVSHTRNVFYLNDGEMAVLSREGIETKTSTNEVVNKKVEKITYDIQAIEKSGYPHYMLKEIFEQPNTIRDAFRGRILIGDGKVKLGGLTEVKEKLADAHKIIIIACGTSWHAALIGETSGNRE